MAFKFVVLFAILAVASAGYLAHVPTHYAADRAVVANPAVDAVASTHQNVVRSFGGTVSHYLKSVDSPYSSIHKKDTHVNNNVYTPAVAKTVTYADPAVYTTHSAPVVTKTVYAHSEPAHVVYAPPTPHTVHTHEQPAHAVYASPAPTAAVYTHHREVPSTATTTYNHGSAATTYTHNSPAVSAYGSSQTVHYSPAELVSHMSFDGFGTHWGY